MSKTNWVAILACLIVGMLIGFSWYGLLFQDLWSAGTGVTANADHTKFFKNGVEMPASSSPMIYNTIAMVAYALLMNWLVNKTGSYSWLTGAKTGAVVGLMMAIGISVGNMFAMNPTSLACVDGTYSFLLFTLFGAILGGLRKK